MMNTMNVFIIYFSHSALALRKGWGWAWWFSETYSHKVKPLSWST